MNCLHKQLISMPKFGTGIGLNRFIRLCQLGNIDLAYFREKSIHIVGSNGKGSSANFCGQILKNLGFQVGTFTSPHLIRFNERIKISGTEISDQELTILLAEYKEIEAIYVQQTSETVGAFEAYCFIAALHFYRSGVDAIVWEAGIGGRYDTTRCFQGKIAALTSIDLEHTELIGSTKREIAYDKSDIVCGKNSHLVFGELDENIYADLKAFCGLKETQTYRINEEFNFRTVNSKNSIHFKNDSIQLNFKTRYTNNFQLINASVAMQTCFLWLKTNFSEKAAIKMLNDKSLDLTDLKLQGRLETISKTPFCVIDVGHSPDAIQNSVSDFFQMKESKASILVIGVSSNKNFIDIAKVLAPKFSTIIITRAYHYGADPEKIKIAVHEFANPGAEIICTTCIEEAVAISDELARIRNKSIYVAGGLFLAIEYREAFEKRDPRDLMFF